MDMPTKIECLYLQNFEHTKIFYLKIPNCLPFFQLRRKILLIQR